MAVNKNISIENAEIRFRNFSGKEGKFNKEGTRNFCVLLNDELADILTRDGWNVRWLQPRDEQDSPQGYIQVAVRFDNRPPTILLISSKGKTILDEGSVSLLDWAEIKNADVLIQPYNWVLHEGTKAEKRGIKAYLKSLYITIVEDEFAEKYRDVPDSATGAIGGCGNCDTCDGSCQHHGH